MLLRDDDVLVAPTFNKGLATPTNLRRIPDGAKPYEHLRSEGERGFTPEEDEHSRRIDAIASASATSGLARSPGMSGAHSTVGASLSGLATRGRCARPSTQSHVGHSQPARTSGADGRPNPQSATDALEHVGLFERAMLYGLSEAACNMDAPRADRHVLRKPHCRLSARGHRSVASRHAELRRRPVPPAVYTPQGVPMGAIALHPFEYEPQPFDIHRWATTEELARYSSGNLDHDLILAEDASIAFDTSVDFDVATNNNVLFLASSGMGKTRGGILYRTSSATLPATTWSPTPKASSPAPRPAVLPPTATRCSA